MTPTEQLHPFHGQGLRLLLAILVVSLNLRGAITCVGPLLGMIQEQYRLSGPAAGLLTSLPLFAFGFLSPYAGPLARRIGIEKSIFVSLLLVLGGLVFRYTPGPVFLYLGTALIGTGISISNVLLPGLLRRDFPKQLAVVTALFTMVMVTCGALGSGISYPLAQWGGWRFSMGAWIVPVVLALLAWLPRLQHNQVPVKPATTGTRVGLWNQPLAWQVSLFMACQSIAFYVLIAWFPSMMSDMENISAAQSGWILFIYQIVVLMAVMLVPVLIHRLEDQRWIGAGCGSLILLSYCGLILDPAHVMVWMVLMGPGAGGSLVLAMTMFGLRSSSATQTVALSGMAQAVGYTLAALAPILVGYIHDLSGGWTLTLQLMIAVALLQVIMGYLAGRALTIPEQN